MITEGNDIELLNNLKQNKISAFNSIYQLYSKSLYIYLLHKLKDPDQCNDVLQDIFITIWEKREQLEIDISVKAYLYQAARFKIIDIYRRDVKYQKYLAELAIYIIEPDTITDRIDSRQKLTEIENAINNLPEKMREIFILSRFEHQTTHDIASKTNLSPQTVKNQISKALRILRINYISIDLVLFFTTILMRK
jgi:RNA polymerase sigma-70 factor (family 1)